MATRRVVLHFPRTLVDQPIVYRLVKTYDLSFNILKAHVTPQEEGLLVMALSGDEKALESGLKYLEDLGLRVQPLELDVVRDEQKCTHCGACIVICPAGALTMDRCTWMVGFDSDKCIACELCVPRCPPRAMAVRF